MIGVDRLRWAGSVRTPAESAEVWLLRLGRLVIPLSLVVSGLHVDGFRFTGLALATVALYTVYMMRYWEAIRSHRLEAAVLVVIAVALGVFYVVTDVF